jgi:hypothetical protein
MQVPVSHNLLSAIELPVNEAVFDSSTTTHQLAIYLPFSICGLPSELHFYSCGHEAAWSLENLNRVQKKSYLEYLRARLVPEILAARHASETSPAPCCTEVPAYRVKQENVLGLLMQVLALGKCMCAH